MKSLMKPLTRSVLLVALMAILPAMAFATDTGAKGKAKIETPAVQATPITKQTLVFFMNPAGRPLSNAGPNPEREPCPVGGAREPPLRAYRYRRRPGCVLPVRCPVAPEPYLGGRRRKGTAALSPGHPICRTVLSGIHTKSGR